MLITSRRRQTIVDNKKIIVIDFDAKRSQALVREIREAGVYSELVDYDVDFESIKNDQDIMGIVLSDSRYSIFDSNAYLMDTRILDLEIPILGIGYGYQVLMKHYQGHLNKEVHGPSQVTLEDGEHRLTGKNISIDLDQYLLVENVPNNFKIIYSKEDIPVFLVNNKLNRYGFISDKDKEARDLVLENFAKEICGAPSNWTMEAFRDRETEKIRQEVGTDKVLLALSGGVDSSVVAALLHHAIGDQLVCVFVNHGLMRKNEAESVNEVFKDHFKINLISVDARDRFLDLLAGVSDPEEKRKIIGNEFIRVFEDETKKLTDVSYLAQGTLYTDVIESGTKTQETIKSHHNVGGLPEDMDFKLIEPLDSLFKDEVRELGLVLGLPEHIVHRQPFPGPGIGIRIIGDITKEKVRIVQDSDFILREEIKNAGLDREIWQYFTVLTGLKSVGQKKGKRSYDYTLAIRAVNSIDGMSADWARIPYDILDLISRRIVNEVEGVNRIVYDITSKPPSTIEWE